MSSEKNRFRNRIALVFLFALAIRILCAWPALWSYMGDGDMESFMRPDSATYYFPARAFVETGKLTLDVGSDFPAVQRPPGYIFFLVAVIFLSCPPVIGCLVDALTVFPVALAGRRLAGRRAGFWAAVLYALNLTALANAPLILADSLLGFLCAWQVFFFVRAWRTKRLSDFLFGAVFAAAATLTKPVNLPVLLGLIPFVLAPVLMRPWRKAACAALLTFLVFGAMVVPWMLRNQSIGAGFVLDRNSGLTALHNTAAILARVNGTDGDTERAALEAEAEAAFADKSEQYANLLELKMAEDDWYLARYKKTVFEHPGAAAATHLFQVWILLPDLPNFLQNLGLRTGERGTLAVLRKDGVMAAFRHYMDGSYAAAFLAAPFLLATGVLYALTATGVWIYLRRRRWTVLTLFAVFVLYYLAAPGPVLMPRYQIPALPFACALAGAVISVCGIRRWRKRRSCPRCNP
ncbi:MAG: glycosyltransferase family 39 protein [Lentisphaeria bacterium]|nr:glycosyltransferase family 39 protein [Lentisphaeria bacterium]